jgi:hypothetical protein
MWTESEYSDAYFEGALDAVDRKAVIDKWTAELKRMEGKYSSEHRRHSINILNS